MHGNVSWELIQLQHFIPDPGSSDSLESQFMPSKPLELKPGTGYNTGMYLITKEAASKVLDYQFPLGEGGRIVQFDDKWMPLRSRLKAFHTHGAAASQKGSYSGDSDVQMPIPSLAQSRDESLIEDCPPLNESEMKLPELQQVL